MQEGIDTTSDSVNLTGTTDWITPPAMTEDHQTPGGHGQGDDVGDSPQPDGQLDLHR